MNGLIALSLSWLLGQTAPSTDSASGSLPAPVLDETQAASALQAAQLEELNARLELLRVQTQARAQEDQARLDSLEQQRMAEQDSREQAEVSRRLAVQGIARGYNGLIALDRLLEAGQDTLRPAVVTAQQDLAEALSNIASTGREDSARLLENVLQRLGTLENSVAQRNPDAARLQLFFASGELLSAWKMSLDQTSLPGLSP